MNQLIDESAVVEKLAGGFDWAEGPLWLPSEQAIIFSDVPNNRIMKYTDFDQLSLYLRPSGYTGTIPRGGKPGSNGLAFDLNDDIILCQHGNRQLARLMPDGSYLPVATHYNGKRLNSPNDVVLHSSGDLYFTDPAYGLEKYDADPAKEQDWTGVYRLPLSASATETVLLTKELTGPNGLAFSPDETKLYVTDTGIGKGWPASLVVYDVKEDGNLVTPGKILFDFTED